MWMKNGDNDNPTHANPRNKIKEGMEEQDVTAFPIVDTHTHLSNHTPDVEIEAMVYVEVVVEPTYRLLKAQWANAQAERESRLRGIVAAAPLEDGEPVRTHLAALKSIGSRIKGVRRVLENEQDNRYVEHVIECFGEDRVIFGGDWPVVLMASSYKRWLETLDEIIDGLSDSAKRKLWAANAKRIYQL